MKIRLICFQRGRITYLDGPSLLLSLVLVTVLLLAQSLPTVVLLLRVFDDPLPFIRIRFFFLGFQLLLYSLGVQKECPVYLLNVG